MRVGQGIFLKLNYADGGRANKQRPFLIINISKDIIYMLNISSVRGKAYKVGFKSNHNIKRYKPPFIYPSFVKLDALYRVENSNILNDFILDEGRAIHPTELSEIILCFNEYKSENDINRCYHSLEDILELNGVEAIKQVAAEEEHGDKA